MSSATRYSRSSVRYCFARTPEEMNFAYAAQRIRELAAALPDPILDDAEICGIVNAISNQ